MWKWILGIGGVAVAGLVALKRGWIGGVPAIYEQITDDEGIDLLVAGVITQDQVDMAEGLWWYAGDEVMASTPTFAGEFVKIYVPVKHRPVPPQMS